MKRGDMVIVYAGRHYGRMHRIVAVHGRAVRAVQVDTGDCIDCNMCDCELVLRALPTAQK